MVDDVPPNSNHELAAMSGVAVHTHTVDPKIYAALLDTDSRGKEDLSQLSRAASPYVEDEWDRLVARSLLRRPEPKQLDLFTEE